MSEPRSHPDLFTAEEAAVYLHLLTDDGAPNVAALKTLRDRDILAGHQVATKGCMYHRDDLDACALRMTGRSAEARRKEMRIA